MAARDPFLFVSHVEEDRARALEIVAELERRNVPCWIAPRDILPGTPFDDEIADAIEASRAILLVFSERCNNNEYIRRELTVAGESRKHIIPFRIEDAQPQRGLRVRLSDLHWIDGFVSREQAIDQVVSTFGPEIATQQRDGAESRAPPKGRIKIDAAIIHGAPDGWFKPGAGKVEWFKDHEHGPEMVVMPAGEFMMGSPANEPGRFPDEGPLHRVTLARPFAVGRHAVTRRQFAGFVNNMNYKMEGGARVWTGDNWKLDPNRSWRNPGFRQDDDHPVLCVNWDDARAYAAWLSEATGHTHRLLSEAEWEYVARAGTATPFWWGSSITPAQANYDGTFVYEGGGAKGEYRRSTVAADSFEANPWGHYNVHGNFWEWCEDIGHGDYNGAPADGSAWLQGGDDRRVVRGGSWYNSPQSLRSANRSADATDFRLKSLGFRVGRTLTP